MASSTTIGRSNEPWELVVLGGGTAGIVAAKTAAGFGARVLLVEADRTGGDCLWTGCVPSKALIAAASVAAEARRGVHLGVTCSPVRVDFVQVMRHVRAAIAEIAPVDAPDALRAAGITVLAGQAGFAGAQTLCVDGVEIGFRQAMITTGASPSIPSVDGLDTVRYLTSETVWDVEQLPHALVVLGGGSIGCELGQAFTRLGSTVTIVEQASRLLPGEDPSAAQVLAAAMIDEGTQVITGVTVTQVIPSVAGDPTGGSVGLADGRKLPFSHLLVAVGRTPRTNDLGLERAAVAVDDRGFVSVDHQLRTTNPRIWAAGDVTGHPQFTHTAGVHGSIAATNAVLGLRRRINLTAEPRVTLTQPEVAAVGVTTEKPPRPFRVLTWAHSHVDRAVAEQQTTGSTKITVDRTGRVVGATVVGPRAGETLGELTVAVRLGLRTRDLAGVTHAYPTWNDGVWNAAIADVRRQLGQPGTIRRGIAALARIRWWWVSRRIGDHRTGARRVR